MIPLPQRRVSQTVRVCAFIQVWVLSLSECLLVTCRHRRIAYDLVAISPNVGNIPNDALRGLDKKKRVGEGSGQRGSKIGCYIECVGAILASVGVNVGW